MEGSVMRTKSKITQMVIALIASVLNMVVIPEVAAREAEPAFETRFQCDSPDVVAQFVAARYPQDVFLIERALHDGTCMYSGTPTPVTPDYFVLRVAAGEKSTYGKFAFPMGKSPTHSFGRPNTRRCLIFCSF
jgi:hypothetical protein